MKHVVFSFFFLFGSHLFAKCQKIDNTKSLRELTRILSDDKIGSGFTIVVFEVQDKEYKKFSVTSSNIRSKRIVDSLIGFKKDFFKIVEEKNGWYAIPIIQIMYEEAKEQILWDNNTYWSMAGFGKNFWLPPNTILLKPLVITSGPPVIN